MGCWVPGWVALTPHHSAPVYGLLPCFCSTYSALQNPQDMGKRGAASGPTLQLLMPLYTTSCNTIPCKPQAAQVPLCRAMQSPLTNKHLACNYALSQWISNRCTRNVISHDRDVGALHGTSSSTAPVLCATSTDWWWGSPLDPGLPSDRSLHMTGVAKVKAAACEKTLNCCVR